MFSINEFDDIVSFDCTRRSFYPPTDGEYCVAGKENFGKILYIATIAYYDYYVTEFACFREDVFDIVPYIDISKPQKCTSCPYLPFNHVK